MNKLIAWLKSIRLAQVLTVFLAGILLFVSTACSGVSASPGNEVKGEVPSSDVDSLYQGGKDKSSYGDVDPRRDTSKTQIKAKGLVDNAKAKTEQSVNNPSELVESIKEGKPLDKRVENLGKNVGESVQELTKGVSEGTQKGIKNVKENSTDAAENVTKAAKRSAQDVKESTQKAAEDTAKSASRAAEDTADAVKGKVSEGVKTTQRALEDTADKLD